MRIGHHGGPGSLTTVLRGNSSQFYGLQKFNWIASHTHTTLLVAVMIVGLDANDGQQSPQAARRCDKQM
ncbi:MAG TPA: hypothetical protein VGR76_03900, partial [Candidatus Angelobacter sp.]|nr:hypothetical protein [Candidatus Angelobacter sp.]